MRNPLSALTATGAVIVAALATATGPVVGAAPSPGLALEPLWETSKPNDVELPYFNLAVDPDGRLWASTPDSTLDIYDRDGTLVETWGTFGRDEGQFDFETPCGPRGGVAFRPDGGFYVSDSDNARVQEFDADRRFVRAWGSYGVGEGQFTGPDSIALDAAGNVHVLATCGEGGGLRVFDPGGTQVRRVDVPGGGPFFALDPDGTIYLIDEVAMDLLAVRPDDTTATLADLSGLISFGTGLVHLPDGGFLVASEFSGGSTTGPENLVHVGADGQIRQVWPNGGWYMALDAAGERFYISSDQLRAYALPAE